MQQLTRNTSTWPVRLSCIHADARRLRRQPLPPASWHVNVASCRNINVVSPTTAWPRRSVLICASQSETVGQTTNNSDSVLKLSEQLWWVPLPVAATFGLKLLKRLAGADVVAKITHPDVLWNAAAGGTAFVAFYALAYIAYLLMKQQSFCLKDLYNPEFSDGAPLFLALGAFVGAFIIAPLLLIAALMALLSTGGCYVLLFTLMKQILGFIETAVKHLPKSIPKRHQEAVGSPAAHDDNSFDSNALVEFDELLAKLGRNRQ